jgi:hypothetical protein
VLLAGLVGCGSSTQAPPDYGTQDGLEIAKVIDSVNDDKSSGRRFPGLFAGGNLPRDYKQFSRYDFSLDGNPNVSGTTATATVKMRSESTSDDVGAKEWAFVKEGNAWKIRSAPLP